MPASSTSRNSDRRMAILKALRAAELWDAYLDKYSDFERWDNGFQDLRKSREQAFPKQLFRLAQPRQGFRGHRPCDQGRTPRPRTIDRRRGCAAAEPQAGLDGQARFRARAAAKGLSGADLLHDQRLRR